MTKEQLIRLHKVIVIAIVINVLAALFSIITLSDMEIELCPIHRLTGFSCPGCGCSRMIVALFKLDLYQAFRYNAFAFLSIPAIIIVAGYAMIDYVLNNQISLKVKRITLGYFIIAMIFGIVRNISCFEWLLPTKL